MNNLFLFRVAIDRNLTLWWDACSMDDDLSSLGWYIARTWSVSLCLFVYLWACLFVCLFVSLKHLKFCALWEGEQLLNSELVNFVLLFIFDIQLKLQNWNCKFSLYLFLCLCVYNSAMYLHIFDKCEVFSYLCQV